MIILWLFGSLQNCKVRPNHKKTSREAILESENHSCSLNKADNPAIGAEQRMLKLFEFYILNFDKFRLLRQSKSCNKEEKSV